MHGSAPPPPPTPLNTPSSFKELLTTCAPYYHESEQLSPCEKDDREDPDCMLGSVPEICYDENMVYDTFNALAGYEYTNPAEQQLKVMKISVPTAAVSTSYLMGIHEDVLMPVFNKEVKAGADVKLVSWDLNIKFDLFTEQLMTDGVLAGAAFFAIYVLMWAQTGSLFVSTLAYIEIMSALGVAYFV